MYRSIIQDRLLHIHNSINTHVNFKQKLIKQLIFFCQNILDFDEGMGCCLGNSGVQTIKPLRKNHKKMDSYYEACTLEGQKSENLKKIMISPDFQDLKMLSQTLSEHFLLYRVPKEQRTHLISCLETYQIAAEKLIFSKGSAGAYFFIIRSGSVEIQIVNQASGEVTKKVLHRGQYFGDLALIYSSPRSASVYSITQCSFYCISYKIFRKTMQQLVRKNHTVAKHLLDKISLFQYLTKRQKHELAHNSLILRYEKGSIIFHEGDDANNFFVVETGQIQIRVKKKQPLILKEGQSFGQNSFEDNQMRGGTAVALENSSLLSIGRESMRKCLGRKLKDICFYNILKWSLGRDQIFKKATNNQIQRLISLFQIKQCKNNEIICFQGDICKFVLIVLEQDVNDKEVGSVFNTEYLFADCENDQRMTERLVKKGDGSIAIISFECVIRVLGYGLCELDKQNPTSHQIRLEIEQKRVKYLNNLSLGCLVIRSKIYEGKYENIYEVEDKYHKTYFLKCMKKKQILQSKMEGYLIKEKQILSILDSPFIIRLYRTFKDPYFIYFLTNQIHGIDFYDLLRQVGICNKIKAQFYTANLLLALEHLHQRGVIFRDLKPENIIVDELGYLNFVNLKLSKKLTQENGFRTFTVAGTPHYMAPQLINTNGYSFSADLWSLGVVLYEIMCGQMPFGNVTDDPYEVFRQIASQKLSFPMILKEDSAKKLIQRLLSKNISDRNIQDFQTIKTMQFFTDFNWQQLGRRSLQTPFRLKSKKQQKLCNEPFIRFLNREILPQRSQSAQNQGNNFNWDAFF